MIMESSKIVKKQNNFYVELDRELKIVRGAELVVG